MASQGKVVSPSPEESARDRRSYQAEDMPPAEASSLRSSSQMLLNDKRILVISIRGCT